MFSGGSSNIRFRRRKKEKAEVKAEVRPTKQIDPSLEGRYSPTIENFYKFCGEGRLMAIRCNNCREVIVPPRGMCPRCHGTSLEWTPLRGEGKLLTYTVIHSPPSQFQAMAPYAVGIVQLEEGAKLPGLIKSVNLDDIRIGMKLTIDFEKVIPKTWPQWARYYFREA